MTMNSMTEIILFIFASSPSKTGPDKISLKIYINTNLYVHGQIEEREKKKEESKNNRKGGREEERKAVLEIHLVCRYAEKKLMPSLIKYCSLKLPIPSPQAATLILMAEFS